MVAFGVRLENILSPKDLSSCQLCEAFFLDIVVQKTDDIYGQEIILFITKDNFCRKQKLIFKHILINNRPEDAS